MTVQGDQEYTAVMLEIAGFPRELQDLKPSRQVPLKPQEAAATPQNTSNSLTTVQQSILESLTIMARQLKDKLESALSPNPLSILGVTYPVFFETSHRELLQTAVQKAADLQPSLSYFQTNSAIASAAANGVQVCECPQWARACFEEGFPSDEMILAIDHSDVLLTAFLYGGLAREDQGIIDTRRALPLQSHNKDRENTYWRGVALDLRDLISRNMAGRRLDHLVLSGSRADDRNLHDAIQSGIGALDYHGHYYFLGGSEMPLDSGNPTLARISREAMTNPVLAAAQGVADLSWRRTMRTCIDPCSQWRLLPSCYEEPRFVSGNPEIP